MGAVNCSLAHGFVTAGGAGRGIGLLGADQLRDVIASCGVRHAAAYGAQVALCALTAKAALAGSRADPARTGLVSNGGPWSADAALAFLRSIAERGHQFVNPLALPATLVSAGPTAAAAAAGAKAFAFAAGFDELAFFEVLMRGHQLLRHGVADHVVVLGCCAGSEALHGALVVLELPTDVFECAIGMLLTRCEGKAGELAAGFALAGAVIGAEAHPFPTVERRYAGSMDQRGLIAFPVSQPLSAGRAFSASGAVLCQAALADIGGLRDAPREFVVSCRKGDLTGAAHFLWTPGGATR